MVKLETDKLVACCYISAIWQGDSCKAPRMVARFGVTLGHSVKGESEDVRDTDKKTAVKQTPRHIEVKTVGRSRK